MSYKPSLRKNYYYFERQFQNFNLYSCISIFIALLLYLYLYIYLYTLWDHFELYLRFTPVNEKLLEDGEASSMRWSDTTTDLCHVSPDMKDHIKRDLDLLALKGCSGHKGSGLTGQQYLCQPQQVAPHYILFISEWGHFANYLASSFTYDYVAGTFLLTSPHIWTQVNGLMSHLGFLQTQQLNTIDRSIRRRN